AFSSPDPGGDDRSGRPAPAPGPCQDGRGPPLGGGYAVLGGGAAVAILRRAAAGFLPPRHSDVRQTPAGRVVGFRAVAGPLGAFAVLGGDMSRTGPGGRGPGGRAPG